MTAWTNRKLARLKECYAVMTRAQLLEEFAPHSMPSIKAAARKLNISKRKDWQAIARNHVPVVFAPRVREVAE